MSDRPSTQKHALIPADLLDLTLDYIGRLPTSLGAHPLFQALHAQVRYVDVPAPEPASAAAETPKPAKPSRRARSRKAAETKGEPAAPTEA